MINFSVFGSSFPMSPIPFLLKVSVAYYVCIVVNKSTHQWIIYFSGALSQVSSDIFVVCKIYFFLSFMSIPCTIKFKSFRQQRIRLHQSSKQSLLHQSIFLFLSTTSRLHPKNLWMHSWNWNRFLFHNVVIISVYSNPILFFLLSTPNILCNKTDNQLKYNYGELPYHVIAKSIIISIIFLLLF